MRMCNDIRPHVTMMAYLTSVEMCGRICDIKGFNRNLMNEPAGKITVGLTSPMNCRTVEWVEPYGDLILQRPAGNICCCVYERFTSRNGHF